MFHCNILLEQIFQKVFHVALKAFAIFVDFWLLFGFGT